jgi:hypothetical protein
MKRTISMKQFVTELGEEFSDNMKEKLMELADRCVLTRKDINYRVDLKHIEHVQHECACDTENSNASSSKKEYMYGQFVVLEGVLYFSEKCTETALATQQPNVKEIYANLSSEGMISDSDICSKKVDDSNIDFIVDSILKVCPPVSEGHLAIVKGMTSRSER